jgi:hypothetical protein
MIPSMSEVALDPVKNLAPNETCAKDPAMTLFEYP